MKNKDLFTELDLLSERDKYNRIEEIYHHTKDESVKNDLYDYLHKIDGDFELEEYDAEEEERKKVNDDGSFIFYKLLNGEDEVGNLVISLTSYNDEEKSKIKIIKYNIEDSKNITSIRVLFEYLLSDLFDGDIEWV